MFQIQIRSGPDAEVLTNEAGEVTSHLQGMFYRTIRMLDNGLKPVFVFDGKPPELKKGELAKRTEKRDKAEEGKKEAEEAGSSDTLGDVSICSSSQLATTPRCFLTRSLAVRVVSLFPQRIRRTSTSTRSS